jgi:hypothetical protein
MSDSFHDIWLALRAKGLSKDEIIQLSGRVGRHHRRRLMNRPVARGLVRKDGTLRRTSELYSVSPKDFSLSLSDFEKELAK